MAPRKDPAPAVTAESILLGLKSLDPVGALQTLGGPAGASLSLVRVRARAMLRARPPAFVLRGQELAAKS